VHVHGLRSASLALTVQRACRAPTGEDLWLPNTERPAWLDGTLPGDRGFDPLGLAKPNEYLQARPRRP